MLSDPGSTVSRMAEERKPRDNRPDPDSVERPSPKQAEKALELRAKAAELAAEASRLEGVPEEHIEVASTVVRNVPNFDVEVLPGHQVAHAGESYDGEGTFSVDGPTAMSLASLGHVTIKGVTEV